MARLGALQENFNHGLDTAIWGLVDPDNISIRGNHLNIRTEAGGANFSTLYSLATYDATNSSASAQVVDAGDQEIDSLYISPIQLEEDADNNVSFVITDNILYANKKVATVETTLASIDYDPETQKFFRIREKAGTTYWEYSVNQEVWTTLHSVSNPITMTAVTFVAYAGVTATESRRTVVKYDNINTYADPPGNKTILYKVYDINGVYLGTLPKVTSEFTYSQDINTAGSEIKVTVGASLDEAGVELDNDLLLIAEGDYLLLDSSGDRLVLDSNVVFNTIPMSLAHRLEVWLYYDGAVNGIKKFDGIIVEWESDEINSTISLSAWHWGAKLDHHLLRVLPYTDVASNEFQDDEINLQPAGTKDANNVIYALGETFTLVAPATISSVFIQASYNEVNPFDASAAVRIVGGTPLARGATFQTASRSITGQLLTEIEFIFDTPSELPAGDYFIEVENLVRSAVPESYTFGVGIDTANNFASGALYTRNDSSGWALSSGNDLTFRIVTSSGALANQFTSVDPSAIMRAAVDNFVAQGGRLSYNDESIEDTGSITSYTFRFNKIRDVINKVIELAPASWYWFIDMGTSLLHFHRQGNTPDHVIVSGKHVNDIKLRYSLQGVKNYIAFSGAEVTPGESLVRIDSNATSLSKFGTWLDTPSDNRVSTDSTAEILNKNNLSQNARPRFYTTLIVPSAVYDIETFLLGQMIGFAGFGNITDDLLLQIVGIDYQLDLIVMQLDQLVPTTSKRIEDIKRNLQKLETATTPDE